MVERVESRDFGVQWDPNVPEAVLVSDDHGHTVLALNPHFDDADHRCVVFVWSGVWQALTGYPNDEGTWEHRLYDKGLGTGVWGEVVLDSSLITPRNQRRPRGVDSGPSAVGLMHFILRLKDTTVEVVAGRVQIERIDTVTSNAALTALLSLR